MDTVSSLIERSTALHLRLLECERVISFAIPYANKRWSQSDFSFLDTEHHGKRTKHLINSSTALITIGRCPQTFPVTELRAFAYSEDSARLAQIGDFYSDEATYDFENAFWKSKDLVTWSPYTSALALQALFASASAFRVNSTLASLCESKTPLARIIVSQTQKLLIFLDQWSTRMLPRELQDYDHAFFAYTALETFNTIHQGATEAERASIEVEIEGGGRISLASVLGGAGADSYASIKVRSLERFHLEFFRQMTFHFAKTPQYLDIATLSLSLFCITTYADPPRKLPDDIVDAALDAIFQLQQPGGFWDTGTPLLGAATGLVGCSSIELANCLLRITRTTANFEKYVNNCDRLLSRIVKGVNLIDPAIGWPTEIRRNGDARQTWYGFLVFEHLTLLSTVLGQHIADLLLKSFQYRKPKPQVPWRDLADFRGYKRKIEENVINPRLNGELPGKAKCSFILFGPPGTGKTSVASALAHKLDWGLVEIGPGDFLANGLNGLFAQGDSIFQRLLLLEKVVVLFDEIDELVSVRDSNSENFNRFVTTYMLPWLQRLRDKGTIIFIFATNHIERFDPAIKRPGRFDLVIPIGPPQGQDRIALMVTAGLPHDVAGAISKVIPKQATLGEVLSAVRDFRSSDEAEIEARIIERLQPERLLVEEKEWAEFEKLCARY